MTRISTAAPAAAATRRALPRPSSSRICWRATSTCRRAARRTRLRAAAARRSHGISFERLLRHDAVAADIDPPGLEGAVRLLHRGRHGDGGAGLELTGIADFVAHDRHIGTHDDLLLAVLVLDGNGGT